MANVLEQQLSYCFTWSSNQLLNLNIFSYLFSQTFFFINSISLYPWIFYHPLVNLFPSFWLFFVLFWMLWMLLTMYKPCYVPHAWRITTWGTRFTETLFSVSKEWARSWSHAFLIIYHKTFAKKFKAVRQKSWREGEKEQEVGDDLSFCFFRVMWLWRHLHLLKSALWIPLKKVCLLNKFDIWKPANWR